MLEFLRGLFASDFMPHGHCYLWKPDLLWMHAGSDALIALAYYLIPVVLIYFVRRRRDLAFSWMFTLFSVFILACGTTHLLQIWSIWHGTYYLTGAVKIVTAAASLATAVLLVPLVPRALTLPSPGQLQEALQAVRVSEERFRSAFDYAAIGMALVGLDGRWLEVNRSLCRIVGYSEAELLERSFQDLTHPDDLDADLGHMERMLAGTIETYQMEKRYFHKEGHVVWVLLNVSAVHDDEGRVTTFISQIQDITARKRAEQALAERADELHRAYEQLREAEQAKNAFFANVSHELRTPLTLILAPLESLLADAALGAPWRERLQIVHNNAARLLQMVTGLLDFSRIEAGQTEIHRRPLDVVAVTRALLDDFEPVMDRKDLALRFDADAVPERVSMDRYMYERIVSNLLSNAVKFTPPGGSLRVRLAWRSGRLALDVADTGIGIDPAHQEQIFEKFRQAEAAATRRFEGAGLGLALVREFAERLGGSARVASTPGEGSTFTVEVAAPREDAVEEVPADDLSAPVGPPATMPVARPAPAPYAPMNGATAPDEETPGRPLVVVAEDNPELAAYIRELLRDTCRVLLAPDGAAAWALIRRERPALILSDVMMPEHDGLALCRRIKANPETASTPVVLLTALTNREALLRGWEAGADEYLYKPFHPRELVTRVRTMLELARARSERENVLITLHEELERRVERRTADLAAARDRAEEIARLKTMLLANMSHEIRTPLTSIIGFSTVLGREVEGRHGEFARLIETSARRLADTLESVLTLAKIESDRYPLTLEPVDLRHEACEAVELFRTEAERKGLTLSCCSETDAGPDPVLPLDRGALGSILHNLISNAVKFTENGHVHVTTGGDAEEVFVRVEDTGIGFDPAEAPLLFGEFVQASQGTRRSHEGVGLGLAITHRLVDLMNGTITAESTPGQGSAFTVRFSRTGVLASLDAEPEADAASAPLLQDRAARPRVLVAEDNEQAALLVAYLLEEEFDVTVVSSAEQALAVGAAHEFDLLLLDINLGSDRDGVDVLRHLRTHAQHAETPAVAVTAYGLPGDRQRFLSVGFDAYLGKPYPPEDLIELAHRLTAA